MYCMGLTFLAVLEILGTAEVLILAFEDSLDFPGAIQIFSASLFVIVGLMVYAGTKAVAKFSLVFLSIVVLSMFLLMLGLLVADNSSDDPRAPHVEITGPSRATLNRNLAPSESGFAAYSSMLALFFPASTGIMAGANRAEALARPKTAIPWGTLGAITTSLVVYCLMFFIWGLCVHHEFLVSKKFLIGEIFWPIGALAPPLIILSSMAQSLQILTVAPKILQAIAADKIVPFLAPFAKLSEKGEPVRALALITGMGIVASMVGDLELIAPVLSLCFLLCYAALNMSCFVLETLHAPTWRPRWRYFNKATALAGTILCVALMFIMAWYWAIVVFVAWIALYSYINWKGVESSWGDGLRGLMYQFALRSLLSQELGDHYSTNWRPQILALVEVTPLQLQALHQNAVIRDDSQVGGGGESGAASILMAPKTPMPDELDFHASLELEKAFGASLDGVLSVAAQLRKGNGLCIVSALMEGLFAESTAEESTFLRSYIKTQMNSHSLRGFPQVVIGPAFMQSRDYVIQTSGLGGLQPNTVLMEYPEGWREEGLVSSAVQFVDSLISVTKSDSAALVLRNPSKDFPSSSSATGGTPTETGTIDVWWILHDGGLMVLLAYLLQKHEVWAGSTLRIFTVVEEGDDSEAIHSDLVDKVEELHIQASVSVVVLPNDAIHPYSVDWKSRAKVHDTFMRKLNVTNEALPPEIISIASSAHRGLRSIPSTVDLEALRLPPFARSSQSQPPAYPSHIGGTFENDWVVEGTPYTFEPDSDDYEYPYGYSDDYDHHEQQEEEGDGSSSFCSYDSSLIDSSSSAGLPPPSTAASAAVGAVGAPAPTPPAIRSIRSTSVSASAKQAAARALGATKAHGSKSRVRSRSGSGPGAKSRARSSNGGEATANQQRVQALSAMHTIVRAKSSELRNREARGIRRMDSVLSTTSTKGDTANSLGLLQRQLTSMVSMANLSEAVQTNTLESLREQHPDWSRLNRVILAQSSTASLVLINLPDVYLNDALHSQRHTKDVVAYMQYIEVLSASLNRVLFVHGTGKELVGSL